MIAAWHCTLQQVTTLLSLLQVICMSNFSNFCGSLIHILDAAYSCALCMGSNRENLVGSSAKSILHSTVSCLVATKIFAKSEEFCQEELHKGRVTIPCLLGYAPPFHTSTIYVLPLLGVAIPELAFISLAPIPSHLAFLPRTFKLAGAMLKVCLFMHLPEAWKYGHAHFFWSLMCKLTYPVAQTRQGDTGSFLYPYLLSITSSHSHPPAQ